MFQSDWPIPPKNSLCELLLTAKFLRKFYIYIPLTFQLEVIIEFRHKLFCVSKVCQTSWLWERTSENHVLEGNYIFTKILATKLAETTICSVILKTMRYLRRFVAGFREQWSGLDLSSVVCNNQIGTGQVIYECFVYPALSHPTRFFSHLNSLYKAGITGAIRAGIASGISLTPTREFEI
jgi:hypothetical protein